MVPFKFSRVSKLGTPRHRNWSYISCSNSSLEIKSQKFDRKKNLEIKWLIKTDKERKSNTI